MILTLSGDLDISRTQTLASELTVEPASGEVVYLDLAGVGFVDLHGVRILLRAARQFRERGAPTRLRAVTPRIRRLLTAIATVEDLSELGVATDYDMSALRERGQALQRRTAELAGAIARTEEEVARVHDELAAGPSRLAGEAAAHARAAPAFAKKERGEAKRWNPDDEDSPPTG